MITSDSSYWKRVVVYLFVLGTTICLTVEFSRNATGSLVRPTTTAISTTGAPATRIPLTQALQHLTRLLKVEEKSARKKSARTRLDNFRQKQKDLTPVTTDSDTYIDTQKPSVGFGHLPTERFDMSKYDSIFLYHTRKAGGTTLRQWLLEVAQKHNQTFSAKEGYLLKDTDFTNKTLYITMLRDPLERAISSYWYEGRWDQKLPKENRTQANARTFRDWVLEIGDYHDKILWQCASNCYSRWFGTTRRTINMTMIFDLSTAVQRLERFDMIIHTEKLRDRNYTSMLSHLLDAEDIRIPFANKGSHHTSTNKYEGMSEKDIKMLTQQNQLDQELLRMAFGNGR